MHGVRRARARLEAHKRTPPPRTRARSGIVQMVLDQTGQIKHELVRQLIAEFLVRAARAGGGMLGQGGGAWEEGACRLPAPSARVP